MHKQISYSNYGMKIIVQIADWVGINFTSLYSVVHGKIFNDFSHDV
jgi:hypothetical protein